MNVNFQTQYAEGNTRLNAALSGVQIEHTFDGKPFHLVIKFNRTTYDSVEVEKTIDRHIARGNQNMIVTLNGEALSLVVEPSPTPQKNDDEIIVSYRILTSGKH